MKIYKILILFLLISFSCDSKQNKVVSNEVVETKNNDLIILSGDYVFYNNAAVLQTNKNVYGIIINEKVNELNEKLSSIKKDEFDFIPVILKGRLKNKDKNDSDSIRNNFKGGSPLALEGAKVSFLKNKQIFEALDKKNLVFKSDKDESKLLDENQLKK